MTMAAVLYIAAFLVPLLLPAESLTCYNCLNVSDPFTCGTTVACQSSEVCFVKEDASNNGCFDMGCSPNQMCLAHNPAPGIIGRSVQERQTGCHECCSKDLCNNHLCQHSLPTECKDDPSFDCAQIESVFGICNDINHAKAVCPRFCSLCNVVDGQWSPWSAWGGCDVTCANGTRMRTRTCTDPAPAHGGLDCSGSSKETIECSLRACPIHGGWSSWSAWGGCPVTCGGGLERRDRTCTNPRPALFGDHCFGDSHEDRVCCTVQGSWSGWSSWGGCSVTCGGELESRMRSCHGDICNGDHRDYRICARQSCSTTDKIAFLAYLGSEINGTTVDQTIVFDDVHTNLGGAYNGITGMFTAPEAGTYVFSLTFMLRYTAPSLNYCELYIRRNNDFDIPVRALSTPEPNGTASGSTVMYLSKGDKVYVTTTTSKSYIRSVYSYFSGYILG